MFLYLASSELQEESAHSEIFSSGLPSRDIAPLCGFGQGIMEWVGHCHVEWTAICIHVIGSVTDPKLHDPHRR